MKWVNAIGLLLQFVAFWLAAPELLGEPTLRRFEKGLKKLVTLLPMIIIWVVILGYGVTSLILSLMKGFDAATNGTTTESLTAFYIKLGVATIVYFIFMVFYKRIKKGLETKLAQPLVEKLINNTETRKQSLILGAMLFSLGFIMQFVVAVI
jgi:hypothetical protein